MMNEEITKEADRVVETLEPVVNQEPVLPVARAPKPPLVTGDSGYIVPKTMDEAYRMAVAVASGGMAPDSYKDHYSDARANPEKVMLGIAAAMEAGLPPLYGLRQIAIINGRPSMWGDSLMALVQGKNLLSNQVVREVGSSFDPSTPPAQWPDDFGISVSLYRRNQEEPYIGTFTVADAKRSNLWMNIKKKPWIEYPKRMLTMRARAFPLRDGFADALAGIAVREEVEDYYTPEDKLLPTTSALDDDEPVTETIIEE